MEGVYQIATGALRSLSEQEMMDCSNQGACRGGVTTSGFIYVEMNKGIDSESAYNYTADNSKHCWKAGAARHVASIDSHKKVPSKSEAQLAAAVALNPVAAMIDGTSAAIQHYKSGVLDDPTTCAAAPSHAVTVVGMTKDYFHVKNSWYQCMHCTHPRIHALHSSMHACAFLPSCSVCLASCVF